MQYQTYEKAYSELQAIIAAVENGALSLDELTVKLREAADLLAFCRTRLREIQTEASDLLRE
ncbi:MAG: exodeoxyribonuclease small subunit [Bacteroidota bacterium]|jgi:exodeoxyribonuclease VII small subunit